MAVSKSFAWLVLRFTFIKNWFELFPEDEFEVTAVISARLKKIIYPKYLQADTLD